MTNFHVIRGASEVQVSLIDQSTYPAKIVGGEWGRACCTVLSSCMCIAVLATQATLRPRACRPAAWVMAQRSMPLLPPHAGDPAKDVAVLQLQAPPEVLANLKPVSLGASSNLVVGQKVGIKK